jgi:hypothetical protein
MAQGLYYIINVTCVTKRDFDMDIPFVLRNIILATETEHWHQKRTFGISEIQLWYRNHNFRIRYRTSVSETQPWYRTQNITINNKNVSTYNFGIENKPLLSRKNHLFFKPNFGIEIEL